jgi:dolichyl-phosphate beta-glucosyltransferase
MEIGEDARAQSTHQMVPHRVFLPATDAPALSLVVPAYNEERRLPETLPLMWEFLERRFRAFELIVVDDGSTDGTAGVVEAFGRGRPQVHLVTYRPNRGKGHALRVGVLGAQGALVLFSDADLATPLEELDHLLARLSGGSDIAIASRAARGARRVVPQPWYRELAGRCLNLMVQAVAVPGIKDTQCGFKLFRRPVALDLFSRFHEDGFSFDIELLHLAHRLGYSVAEVPVRWMHREGSKVRLSREAPRMFVALLRIRRRHLDLQQAPNHPHFSRPAPDVQVAGRS